MLENVTSLIIDLAKRAGEFLSDVFDFFISSILFLLVAVFLGGVFFWGLHQIKGDFWYYLPFLLVPPLVILIPWAFRKRVDEK